MDQQGEADAPLLTPQKPDARAGASVDPKYNALSKDEGGRRGSITSLDSESDLELDDMHTDYQRVVDDEERGLRENAREDHIGPMRPEDIADGRASVESSRDMWQEAARLGKREFLKKAAINAALIAMWYAFSICISVVSTHSRRASWVQQADLCSTINGCSRQAISISRIHYSPRLSIWSSSSRWHPLSYSVFLGCDPDTVPSILTMKTRVRLPSHQLWKRVRNQ